MSIIIRKTYPREFSLGVLVILFTLVFFLSGQLFGKTQPEILGIPGIYVGEFLVSCAVITMVLILWEEILFPIKAIPSDGGLLFRNHQSKLKIQGGIYILIPAIVLYLFFTFETSTFRFIVWAAVCLALPILGKLMSGINNIHDFLTLTPAFIAYKDNEEEGKIEVKDIRNIRLIPDGYQHTHQLELILKDDASIVIELHKMELDDFIDSIEEYINEHYVDLVKE